MRQDFRSGYEYICILYWQEIFLKKTVKNKCHGSWLNAAPQGDAK